MLDGNGRIFLGLSSLYFLKVLGPILLCPHICSSQGAKNLLCVCASLCMYTYEHACAVHMSVRTCVYAQAYLRPGQGQGLFPREQGPRSPQVHLLGLTLTVEGRPWFGFLGIVSTSTWWGWRKSWVYRPCSGTHSSESTALRRAPTHLILCFSHHPRAKRRVSLLPAPCRNS